jgi:hypothetical protein
MNAFKNFLLLLTFVSYPFLGCMEERVELLIVKEMSYGTRDEKTDLLNKIDKIICAYKNECDNAFADEVDLRNLIPSLTKIKGILDNLLKNPLEAKDLSIESLHKISNDLANVSGDNNIGFVLYALENVIENLTPKQQSRLKKLCFKNLQAIGCVSTISLLLMLLFIYFAYCGYHEEEGICSFNRFDNNTSINNDPCGFSSCDRVI